MTLKKQRRTLGKQIRVATGLKLPIAMRLAKLVIKGDSYFLLQHPNVTSVGSSSLCESCLDYHHHSAYIAGPKGTFPV